MLTIRETAQYCRVSVPAIYQWMEQFQIQWVTTPLGRPRICPEVNRKYRRLLTRKKDRRLNPLGLGQ